MEVINMATIGKQFKYERVHKEVGFVAGRGAFDCTLRVVAYSLYLDSRDCCERMTWPISINSDRSKTTAFP